VVGGVGGKVGGGVGGSVGGGVGGGVGNGVGGTVGVVSGNAVAGTVVAHPRPTVMQQKSFCSWDHRESKSMKPSLQSKRFEVDEVKHDKSQQSRGINNKLKRQQLVIKQVKSLLGRTTSKSPPQPTNL
jgi:uncharacterized protein YcfJ